MDITKIVEDKISIDESFFEVVGENIFESEKISRPLLTYWQDAFIRLKKNKIAMMALCILMVFILLAIFAPIFSKYNYKTIDHTNINQDISSIHWFGTDALGRDLWVRTWRGARVSLFIGVVATFVNTVVGTVIGCISGYKGGKIDMLIMRFIEVLAGIPHLILTIMIMLVLGQGVVPLIVAMIITGWTGTARMIRGQVLQLKEQEFVQAAKILGVSNRAIIFTHIIPNVMGILITNMSFAIPRAIFNEAFLSFIGIGIAPPECSLGELAKSGSAVFKLYPYRLFIPAGVISTLMLSFSLFGDGLRDALDPSLRGVD